MTTKEKISPKAMFKDGVEYIHGSKMYRRNPWFNGEIECLTMGDDTHVEPIGIYWFIVTNDVYQRVVTRVDKFCSTGETVP